MPGFAGSQKEAAVIFLGFEKMIFFDVFFIFEPDLQL